jgi:hypothetical protein
VPALRAGGRHVRYGLRGRAGALVGRWSGMRSATAHGLGRRLGAGWCGPTGCSHGLLAREWVGGVRAGVPAGAARCRPSAP